MVIMAGCFCSCSNDEEEVVPSPLMQSELILQAAFDTDAKTTPFVSNDDFLFLQWYLSSTYTYFPGVDGKSSSLTANPMACVIIGVEEGTFVPEVFSDLTNVQEVSSESFSNEGFVWFEKVLSIGPKIVTLRWGSDVEVVQNAETQNIVFPHLEFSQPRAFSCGAVATGETDGNGKVIYRVDFETSQTLYSVDADKEFSEKETYRIHWFVAL